jgi:hypothetical protein
MVVSAKSKRPVGGSGSSNPESRRFRSQVVRPGAVLAGKHAAPAAGAAKAWGSKGGSAHGGRPAPAGRLRGAVSSLTTASLRQHEVEIDEHVPVGLERLLAPSDDDPFAKVCFSSFLSFLPLLSIWSAAHPTPTNVQVRRLATSNNEDDREAVAVLMAVTQSIAEQGLPESPTAFWAALVGLACRVVLACGTSHMRVSVADDDPRRRHVRPQGYHCHRVSARPHLPQVCFYLLFSFLFFWYSPPVDWTAGCRAKCCASSLPPPRRPW